VHEELGDTPEVGLEGAVPKQGLKRKIAAPSPPPLPPPAVEPEVAVPKPGLKRKNAARFEDEETYKKRKEIEEAHFAVAQYGSYKEWLKGKTLWKYIDDEGLEAGVKYLEEENSTQTPAEYSIMEFYREQLARLKISGSSSGISSIERRS